MTDNHDYLRNNEKRRIWTDIGHEDDVMSPVCRLPSDCASPKAQVEHEKRIRREIANSNERRRMQSINAGFQSLRALLPEHNGEKLSKAAILQHTTEYIIRLESDKSRLAQQNQQLKRLAGTGGAAALLGLAAAVDSDGGSDSPHHPSAPLKRKKRATDSVESSDEGIGMHCSSIGNSSPPQTLSSSSEMFIRELRAQLERERALRLALERKLDAIGGARHVTSSQHNQQHHQQQQQIHSHDEGVGEDEEMSYADMKPPMGWSPDGHSGAEDTPQDLSVPHSDMSPMRVGGETTSYPPSTSEHDAAWTSSTIKQEPLSLWKPTSLWKQRSSWKDTEFSGTDSAEEGLSDDEGRGLDFAPPTSSCSIAHTVVAPPPSASLMTSSTLSSSSSSLEQQQQRPRQNLDTIVEAIRHLEGDHLFAESSSPSPSLVDDRRKESVPVLGHLAQVCSAEMRRLCAPRPGVIVSSGSVHH